MDHFSDCDDGPTKRLVMAMKDQPEKRKFYDLCFGKRPEVELYDCRKDPDQVVNLASDPKFAESVAELRGKLEAHLETTADPRFTDAPVEFSDYRYK
jgi:hypothetical protein